MAHELQALVPFSQQQVLATAIAKSGLFGMKTPEQALVLMALCESEGLHPIRAAQDYHLINGKPSMKSDAMLSRFQAAGGRVNWREYSDERCVGEFSHPSSPTPVTVDWDLERAKRAGVLGNPTWQKYPRAMLRARCASEGIRAVYPGVLGGMYTPEEVESFTASSPPREEKDITPAPPPAPPEDGVAISSAQHRALEARIRELGLDRERVKAWVYRASRQTVEHFPALSPALFQRLWDKLPEMAEHYHAEQAEVALAPILETIDE